MDLDNTQVSINKPLICSSTGCFTGDVTAWNLCNQKTIYAMLATKQYITTELTNCSQWLRLGDNLSGKDLNPSTSIAALDIDNGLTVKSLNDNFNSEEPFTYFSKGNRIGSDRHHRVSGSTCPSDAKLS